jgi:ribosomal protein L37AE/L43A
MKDPRVGNEISGMNPKCPNCREYYMEMLYENGVWTWKCKYCKSKFGVAGV